MRPNLALWVLQSLLAVFFIVASGAPKFFLPDELLNMPLPIPRGALLLIGTAEILGGLGLVLPGLTRRHVWLTARAAAGLVLLTACATVYQLLARQPESAVFAAALGVLCAVVAYGRWRVGPQPRQLTQGVLA